VGVPCELLLGTNIYLGQKVTDISGTVDAFKHGFAHSSDSRDAGYDYYYASLGIELPFSELLVIVTSAGVVKKVILRSVHRFEQRDLDSLAVMVSEQCIDFYGDNYLISDSEAGVGLDYLLPRLSWQSDSCRVSLLFTPQRFAIRDSDGEYASSVFFQLTITSQSKIADDYEQPVESTSYTRKSLGLE
jgi:hypothetical protein